ncbi:MAG: GNAT family N-acetyltransferase [Chloroflexi bacterium]|nr:GNAT family N-acetyltransferase [Chloroflexota bacterium]
MNIKEYKKDDLHKLFEYWQKMGAAIPYFFPVSASKWQTCLLEDELEGEKVFKSLETYVATESDQVLGFVQYGQPNFAWDENGNKYSDPQIGVIRHLYFERGRNDVGEALLAKISDRMTQFQQNHAFYHAFGMSCNAHHGKLHSSQSHVEQLLQAHGFAVEHENIYYVLDMNVVESIEDGRLQLKSAPEGNKENFQAQLNDETIATAQVRYMGALTNGYAHDVAYLTWIGMHEQHQGKGIGTEFLQLLVEYLTSKGYRYLHTDTASDNLRAQHFYEAREFDRQGCSRCYIKV